MAGEADYLIDRRRLKATLMRWRVGAVLAVVVALLVVVGRFDSLVGRQHVSRLTVDGIIFEDVKRDEALEDVADDDSARALIVRINSPGGTVVGGEALYTRLRQVARNKPVVAVIGELGTSAAYMTALGCDRILAREGSLTGSIGVILQATDLTGLFDKVGIKPETVKSSPLKAQPNPFETFTPEARAATRDVVLNMYEMFVAMVGERRELAGDRLKLVADGRVFTGRQAVQNNLIDDIGGEEEARLWLEEAHSVARDLPTRDVAIRVESDSILDLVGGIIGKGYFREGLTLDGLVAIWQPGH